MWMNEWVSRGRESRLLFNCERDTPVRCLAGRQTRRHRQQFCRSLATYQQHVSVLIRCVGFSQGSTKMRLIRPSFDTATETLQTWWKWDACTEDDWYWRCAVWLPLIILWIRRRATVNNFSLMKNPISRSDNLSICSCEYSRRLVAEKNDFEFFTVHYLYFIDEVDELCNFLVWNFLRMPFTKNY